jgi:1,4-dihydroxy-2-naphthoate octaprenyltransferase
MKKEITNWIAELRAPFLLATLVSVFLGTSIAWARAGIFDLQYFLLALSGSIFLHLGANLINDYFDHESGNDEINKEFVRPFSGGSRMIQLGLLTPRKVLSSALTFFGGASLIGIYLTWTRGFAVLALALIGLVSAAFYTGGPFNWASRGVGETLVGINFGALMTFGAYYVQTRAFSVEPLIVSIPVSLLIAAVLYINEFPDYAADKAVGKNTLVVRLGREKASFGYMLIVLGSFAAVSLAVLFGIAPFYTLLALIPLPLALSAIKLALQFHSQPMALAPANGLTIVFHFLASLLLSLGYLGYRFEVMSSGYISTMTVVGICALTTISFYWKTNLHREKPCDRT